MLCRHSIDECVKRLLSPRLYKEAFNSVPAAIKSKVGFQAEAGQLMKDKRNPNYKKLIGLYKALGSSPSTGNSKIKANLRIHLHHCARHTFSLKEDSDERQEHFLLAKAAEHLVV